MRHCIILCFSTLFISKLQASCIDDLIRLHHLTPQTPNIYLASAAVFAEANQQQLSSEGFRQLLREYGYARARSPIITRNSLLRGINFLRHRVKSYREQKLLNRLHQIASSLDRRESNMMSHAKIMRFETILYRLIHSYSEQGASTTADLINRRINHLLINRGIRAMLLEMGYLPQEQILRMNFVHLKNIMNSLLFVAFTSQRLPYIPRFNLLEGITLPDDLIERIIRYGLAANRNEIYSHLGRPAQFDLIFRRIKRVYVWGVRAYIVYFLASHYEWVAMAVDMGSDFLCDAIRGDRCTRQRALDYLNAQIDSFDMHECVEEDMHSWSSSMSAAYESLGMTGPEIRQALLAHPLYANRRERAENNCVDICEHNTMAAARLENEANSPTQSMLSNLSQRVHQQCLQLLH